MKSKCYRLGILSKGFASKNSVLYELLYQYWRNAEFLTKSKGYRLGSLCKSCSSKNSLIDGLVYKYLRKYLMFYERQRLYIYQVVKKSSW